MKQLLIGMCFFSLLWLSCKKDETPPPPPPTPTEILNGWQKINTNIPSNNFSDVAFRTPADGVLATYDKGVYRTADSGKTWVHEPTVGNNPVTINFFNSQYGYAVGDNDFYLTTNGAASWRSKRTSVNNGATDVCFVSPAIGYLARQAGSIYKTTDSGQTWQSIAPSSSNICISVFFLNEQRGWYARGDSVFQTANGGLTWSSQKVSQALITTVFFTNATNGWLAADTSVYRTTDGGVTWLRTGLGETTFDLHFLNGQVGYASTSNGVWKTVDGGVTWKKDLTAIMGGFPELVFLDENTGWVIGSNNILYRWKK